MSITVLSLRIHIPIVCVQARTIPFLPTHLGAYTRCKGQLTAGKVNGSQVRCRHAVSDSAALPLALAPQCDLPPRISRSRQPHSIGGGGSPPDRHGHPSKKEGGRGWARRERLARDPSWRSRPSSGPEPRASFSTGREHGTSGRRPKHWDERLLGEMLPGRKLVVRREMQR
jgi:hypothetical protein